MYWNEDKKKEKFEIPDDIVDVSFVVKCKCLPLEHMESLSESLYTVLPWLEEEKLAGIHPINGAESGNGWERSHDPNELIYLSRRQKMTLRLPKQRLAEAETMVGKTINVEGYDIEIGKSAVKKLSDLPTAFCRSILIDGRMDEQEFMQWAFEELKALDITVRKMMPGIERVVTLADNKERVTRGLMVAELKQDESVRLQQYGMGEGRKLGCGIFMPQKDIKAVNSDD
ncbi:MAG: type I-MYXAN CRISPR-associated protein Cas6/Cmx6 [Gammaproteobacteria bacterium]|nr:type I-MYXAN CRISPR-associated protein Cas6/Cmx6 [Gammaproteobacteria bacterium]